MAWSRFERCEGVKEIICTKVQTFGFGKMRACPRLCIPSSCNKQRCTFFLKICSGTEVPQKPNLPCYSACTIWTFEQIFNVAAAGRACVGVCLVYLCVPVSQSHCVQGNALAS